MDFIYIIFNMNTFKDAFHGADKYLEVGAQNARKSLEKLLWVQKETAEKVLWLLVSMIAELQDLDAEYPINVTSKFFLYLLYSWMVKKTWPTVKKPHHELNQLTLE